MQKVTFCLILLMVMGIGNLSAQTRVAATEIPGLKLSDGKNTVRVPDGSGSFEFVKRGDKFSDIVFKGRSGDIRLVAIPGSTNGKPPTSCKYPIPDACYGIPNSSEVAMCFCKPTDKSSGEYTVTFVKAVLYGRKAGDDKRQDY